MDKNLKVKVIAIAVILAFIVFIFIQSLIYGILLQLITKTDDGILAAGFKLIFRFIKAITGTGKLQSKDGIILVAGVVIFLLIAISAINAIKLYYPLYKRWRRDLWIKRRTASSAGTSEWGSLNEAKTLLGNDGVIIGGKKKMRGLKPVRLSARYSFEHIAIIGPTGAGKSSTFFIPNLLALPKNTSVIVTDPKGELEALTAEKLRKEGWETYTFSPFQPDISSGYDPLRLIETEAEIADIADIILKNGYDPEGKGGDTQWINFAKPLWEASLYATKALSRFSNDEMVKMIRHISNGLKDKGGGKETARYLRRFLSEGGLGTIDEAANFVTYLPEAAKKEIIEYIGGTALDRYLTYTQSLESPETAGSIRTVLTSSVQIFARPDVSEIAKKENKISFKSIRTKPTVIYVRIPERKAHILKPLMATFFWQSIEHIADTDGNPIFFLLDEFPNIGKIPGFAQMAATLRSRKISLCVALQGIEQLSREYSEHEQKDIINNLKTKIYYPGSTGETAEYASRISGYSTTGKDTRVELLTAAEARMIPEGKIMIMARNLPPFFLEAYHYKNLYV